MSQKNKEMTNRAKQALATKNRILSEGRKLILKKGYQGATIDEICKNAEITVGTYYYYFKGKDDLIKDFFPKLEDFQAKYGEDDSKSSFQKITEYFSFFNRQAEKNIDVGIVQQLFHSEKALFGLDEERIVPGMEFIIEGQIKGEIQKDVKANYLSKMIFAATRGITMHWAMHEETIKLGETTEDLVERLLFSFLTKDGKEKAEEYLKKK